MASSHKLFLICTELCRPLLNEWMNEWIFMSICVHVHSSPTVFVLGRNSCSSEETWNVQNSLWKTHTHKCRWSNTILTDSVTSGMTNRPCVAESHDLIHVCEAALQTGFPQTLKTRMSYLIDQNSTLAFGCLLECVCVCVGKSQRKCVTMTSSYIK